ncbi:MAG: hypothetical protein ABJA34_07260 [Pseudonocardiales bacterium]
MRSIRREAVTVCLGGTLLAALMTWPTLRHPASTVPNDIYDPLAEVWIASYGGHGLLTAPLHLFDSNTFWPLADSYAFNDTLLGYAPLTVLFGGGGMAGALVRYNVLFVLAHALAFAGAYALARQLGSRPAGAMVAGAAFAYAPWRLAHDGQLNILSSGAIPLALAMLARGHGFGRQGYAADRVRPRWIVGGWLVAAWQVTLGFSLGLSLAYLLLLVGLLAAAGWLLARRPALPRRLLGADAVGGLAFTAVAGLLAIPYLRVVAAHPEGRRGAAEVALFSPPLSGYLVAPEQSRVWGAAQAASRAHLRWPGEMALLPGFMLMILAVAGLLAGAAPLRHRVGLWVATVASVLLGLGTTLAGGRYTILPMQAHLPGWASDRTTGRLVLFTTLALGLLAAYAVTAVQERLPDGGRWAALMLVFPLIVTVEGVGHVAHPTVPPFPAALREVQGPALVLPSDGFHDAAVMTWSTWSWPDVVNGSSSLAPRQIGALRQRVAGFPDAASVSYLRGLGVRTVVLLPGYAEGSPWQGAENRPVTGLPLTRRQVSGGDWVYVLDH